jgi:NAD(P)-dependent dehydrogenase (short-subunit alcohol dehydrogenase family)
MARTAVSLGSGYAVSNAAAWSAVNALRLAMHDRGITVTALHVARMDSPAQTALNAGIRLRRGVRTGTTGETRPGDGTTTSLAEHVVTNRGLHDQGRKTQRFKSAHGQLEFPPDG